MNISKIMCCSVALPLLAIGGIAQAQNAASDSDSGQVAVTGSVARLCILGEPSQAVVNLGQMAQTSGVNVGRIAALASQTVTLPASFCNFAGSVVSVSASALVGDSGGTPPPGFAKAVNYTATASGWAADDAVATSLAGVDGGDPENSGAGGTQPDPKQADIDVQLANYTVPGNALLVAGAYTGLVTVTLGPVPIAE